MTTEATIPLFSLAFLGVDNGRFLLDNADAFVDLDDPDDARAGFEVATFGVDRPDLEVEALALPEGRLVVEAGDDDLRDPVEPFGPEAFFVELELELPIICFDEDDFREPNDFLDEDDEDDFDPDDFLTTAIILISQNCYFELCVRRTISAAGSLKSIANLNLTRGESYGLYLSIPLVINIDVRF